VAQLCALKLSRRALAVQTGAGTLASRERRQAHHLEQLRSLFMAQSSPIVRCGRTQVGGFDVRHAPRVSAETNATVMIPVNPFASLTYLPARQNPRAKVRRSIGCRERRPAQGAWRGASLQRRAAAGACAATQGVSVPLKINKRAFRRAGMDRARGRT
jgi:hypothetical protein